MAQKKCTAEAMHKKYIAPKLQHNFDDLHIGKYAKKSMYFYQVKNTYLPHVGILIDYEIVLHTNNNKFTRFCQYKRKGIYNLNNFIELLFKMHKLLSYRSISGIYNDFL